MNITHLHNTGILIPLWTLSHRGDQGIGDIGSLRALLPWIAEAGLTFVQLLPINETDSTFSPYSAISSVALDPMYLDLSKIPGIEVTPVEKTDRVNYPEVKVRKDKALRAAFIHFKKSGNGSDSFLEFQQKEASWLMSYCGFRVLMHLEGERSQWERWSPEYNTRQKATRYIIKHTEEENAFNDEAFYRAWLQWHCHTQWKELNNYAQSLGIKLMGDIPVGVSYNSADVFYEAENFDLNWSGGAPPETFFKDDQFAIKWGQNWGVPTYNDDFLRQTNFAWWKRRVRKHTEIFSMFRIDHVLGLYRFYSFPWQPSRNAEFLPLSKNEAKELTGGDLPGFKPHPDDTTVQRAHNLLRGDEILTHLQEAAPNAEIIGEDLGLVPEYVRPHLEEKEIAGFRICHWETDKRGKLISPSKFPYQTFATFSTHDHPPISTVWNEYRSDLDSKDSDTRKVARKKIKLLAQIVGLEIPQRTPKSQDIPEFTPDHKWRMLDYLSSANSRFRAFMITDLLDDPARFNTPSTVGSHNWTHRIQPKVEEFYTSPDLKEIQERLKLLTGHS